MEDRHKELGEFLKAKRSRTVVPDTLFAGFGRRRVSGLRREEVAQLALISTTYYTKLERGKVTGISESVLDGLTGALDLTEQERQYVRSLIPVTGTSVVHPAAPEDEVSPVLQRVVDSIVGAPAHVLNERCDIVAANALGRALYPWHHEDPEGPNSVRFLFCDPRAREFFVDWRVWADQGVYYLRGSAARDPGDTKLAALIRDLSRRSAEFRDAWHMHDVRFDQVGTRSLVHPEVGRLDLDFQGLQVVGQPRLRLTVYTGAPGSSTAAGLERLAGEVAG